MPEARHSISESTDVAVENVYTLPVSLGIRLCALFEVFCLSDAVFGDTAGGPRQKVVLTEFSQIQVQTVERRYNESPEKLAVGLLLLLFSSDELRQGNCTKPVRKDIKQLDSERPGPLNAS